MTYRPEDAPTKGEADFEEAVDKAYNARWWESHDQVAATARFMADNGYDGNELANFIEKPWKWTDEFVKAEAAYAEDSIEAWVDTTPPGDAEGADIEPVDEDIFRGDR